MSVLCLITNPADPALTKTLVDKVHREVGGELNWLTQGTACEIIKPKSTDPAADARELLAGQPIDAALVPLANRRKKLLIADMDSTMINEECIDELADALGLKDQVADITARAMNGELDFGEALETRVALLKGLSLKAMEEVRRERITLAPGGRVLVHTMKAYGAYTALISGGFTYFADHFAKRIGFDEAVANVLETDGDVLTGTVTKPIVDKATKLVRLETLLAEKQIPTAQSLAVGDGANDLPMLRGAGLGVALHAKPAVAEQARVRIDHGDLTALLYLQGYGDEDFVR
ncbi:phosphoserine phosphatase SerB [Mariluticola halotolerans]|uniref:phosphoserine phosphatase SerB n=1 Tax=Mariluticola halotolerans TaxID=2909283 RepID=UPI0026E2D932|nr:phosphoserine phosphatase SerB [Mariluticola halotolerans]UJQ94643.1 phosphoserine phosphatase SerB [Mariluticola halotolerans]